MSDDARRQELPEAVEAFIEAVEDGLDRTEGLCGRVGELGRVHVDHVVPYLVVYRTPGAGAMSGRWTW